MDSDKLPLHDPQSYRQLMEIALFTRDLRHISGKNNLVADWLSRGGANPKQGEIFQEPDDAIQVSAAETVQLQGISLDALAELQQCEEIEKVKKGQHPSTFKFQTIKSELILPKLYMQKKTALSVGLIFCFILQ